MTSIPKATVRNRLLRALPPAEWDAISPHLTRVELVLGQHLQLSGEPIEHVHFVEAGFISALGVLTDGHAIEIGLIGSEGVAGGSIVLGAVESYCENMCQTEGSALRIPAPALMNALEKTPTLKDLLLRHAHAFHVQVAQTAACNAHHEMGQRLCRWLLAARDRSDKPALSLTQDLIAVMLGVRRPTVSVAAGILQKAGLIRYQHGHITIVDRVGLEDASCECYQLVASEYRRQFGDDIWRATPAI